MGQNFGVQIAGLGGFRQLLNINAPVVVKALPGKLFRIVINAPGSAGQLTLNDNNQTGATNVAANQILSLAFSALSAGEILELNWPVSTGICISSMPTGGQVSVSYS